MTARGDLLIYCPLGHGGVAEYAHYQARALHRLGVEVRVLAAQDFLQGRQTLYPVERILPAAPTPMPGAMRKLRHALWLVSVPWLLANRVWRDRPSNVLLASYSEYLSPLWVWPHLLLHRWLGIRYGAILHDPVRDFQLGPRWWHLLSVRLAYKALQFVIVHESDGVADNVPLGTQVFEAPHGIYDAAPLKPPAIEGNERWDFPTGKQVLLSFGHIRDNKNIDLLIRALPYFPTLCLIIAGPAPAGGQRTESFYRNLAAEMGVADRFRMIPGFVADDNVSTLFAKATWIATTYAASFRSHSAVLTVAVRARKLVLASSGPSPMRNLVERYKLGVFVEPDSLKAIVRGLRLLMNAPPVADWKAYGTYASWNTNAEVVMAAFGLRARAPNV